MAAEYALVGSRRSKIESLARNGSGAAKLVLEALDERQRYVAGSQVAITMAGIGLGSIVEPVAEQSLEQALGRAVPDSVSIVVALIVVTYVMVVVGELIPKYLTLRSTERVALLSIRPLRFFVAMLSPLVWLVQKSGQLALRPFGIRVEEDDQEVVTKDELVMLLRAGSAGGTLDEHHAVLLNRALRFDKLDVSDIMVHRLDIQWVDVAMPQPDVLEALGNIPHSRVPVCKGDLDDIVGILYIQDYLRHAADPNLELASIVRPVVAIPENLTLNRVVTTMRETKSQILVVVDEYGGTSGLVTLEDVVEEIFGELDDQLESERPPIERVGHHRVSARADVRYDEVLEFLGREPLDADTSTLAEVIVTRLGRVPNLGDSVEDELGRLRVENMARRRITRVSIQLVERQPTSTG